MSQNLFRALQYRWNILENMSSGVVIILVA